MDSDHIENVVKTPRKRDWTVALVRRRSDNLSLTDTHRENLGKCERVRTFDVLRRTYIKRDDVGQDCACHESSS